MKKYLTLMTIVLVFSLSTIAVAKGSASYNGDFGTSITMGKSVSAKSKVSVTHSQSKVGNREVEIWLQKKGWLGFSNTKSKIIKGNTSNRYISFTGLSSGTYKLQFNNRSKPSSPQIHISGSISGN
ncbi:hypothetical protein O0R52_19880 [Bacillus halotolerans]|uniref:Uncharacterized protein n=1 Tax=Bacillus halotolerans TaxID=260554 RepID=A0ABY7HZU3_9BACI|nr:hypothetical protein [Bacillus halotolerans]MDG0764469.1 hypothetical protein [Bacillus halotolerans]QQF62930.1 hypothetical protein I9X38_00840 [Bacillus mojavensis]UUI84151.1 hypothetical protein NPA28_19475 [Bacillus halotolerans]WAT21184.1 hypothetical protein O0R52_19880 [Bacillus halotolerans]